MVSVDLHGRGALQTTTDDDDSNRYQSAPLNSKCRQASNRIIFYLNKKLLGTENSITIKTFMDYLLTYDLCSKVNIK